MKTSAFKGISFHKVRGRWRSEISISSRNVHLGYFDSAADAARAYDRAVLKRDGRQAHLNFSISDYESELATIESFTMEELVSYLRGKAPNHHSVKSESISAAERQKQQQQRQQQQQQQRQQLLQNLQQDSLQKARVVNELQALPTMPVVQRIGPESPIPVLPHTMNGGVKRNASYDHIQRVLPHPQSMCMGPAGSPPPLSARSSPELSMSEATSVGGTARSAFSRYRTPNGSTANSVGTSPSASPSPRCYSPTSSASVATAAAAGAQIGNAHNHTYDDPQQATWQQWQTMQNSPLYFFQSALQAQMPMFSTSPKCGQAFLPAFPGLGPEAMQSIQYTYAQPSNTGIVANQFAGR